LEKSQENPKGGGILMILPKAQDVIHSIQLTRLLQAITDDTFLAQQLYFKGGTCATMLGYLDRFSVDLDFDLKKGGNKKKVDLKLIQIFKNLDLFIKNKSKETLFYVLKYKTPGLGRNTLKISVYTESTLANQYTSAYIAGIDRYVNCQTIETMFANKLVALTERYVKRKQIAGRDLYDIHYFFLQGYNYNEAVIQERIGKKPKDYFKQLIIFIKKYITNTIIDQDLNILLHGEMFKKVRNVLKQEVITMLKAEIRKLEER